MRACIYGHEVSYEELMARWGYCLAGEAATIGHLLRILRERSGESQVFQRCCFGISEADFRRLQRMVRPREDHFLEDVRRTATACNVTDHQRFVTAMEQACRLG